MNYPISWWAYTKRYFVIGSQALLPVLRNLETQEELSEWQLPIGACWECQPFVYGDTAWAGADGKAICCVLPGGHHWHIDSRASNCTMPNDNVHRCWVRHSTIGEPIHVDKAGVTCAAGAGSIAVPGWHGFLHHGILHE